jgi:hypothetical protein
MCPTDLGGIAWLLVDKISELKGSNLSVTEER